MSESISATIKNSGLTLDSVFVEVQHSEGLNLPKANHIRFFHTAMRGNRCRQIIYRYFCVETLRVMFSPEHSLRIIV